MSNAILTILILVVLAGGTAYFVFQFKPRKKAQVKDLYSEGLDMMVSGHLRAAYNAFKTIVQKDTENINAYLKLGQVVREGKNPEQALKIHKSLTLRKQLSLYAKLELHKNLALDYLELNRYQDSISEAEQVLSLDKRNEWALEHLVNIHKSQDDWAKAAESQVQLQKIRGTENSKEIGKYRIQEGKSLLRKEDFSKARELFEEALNIDESLANAYFYIGNSYAQESEHAYKAAMDYDRNDPVSPDVDSDYNESLNQAKQILSKAIPMWVKFGEMAPEKSGRMINRLKDALFALNRFDELEVILKKILANDPDNTDVISCLADYYNQKGEEQNASELLDTAVEKAPDSLLVKAMRVKLKLKENASTGLSSEMDAIIQGISQVTNEEDPISI